VKGCLKWARAEAAVGKRLYREGQERRFDQTSNECHSLLVGLTRSKDEKVRERAIGLYVKLGAQAWGKTGTMVVDVPKVPLEGNAEIHARLSRVLDEARTEIDRKRAKAGQPPVSNDEFMEAWKKEVDARPPKREPI